MKLDQRGCIRVLDPETDFLSRKGGEVFKEMLYLSNPSDLINTQPAADFSNLNEVFYSPPKSNWCLNYQNRRK